MIQYTSKDFHLSERFVQFVLGIDQFYRSLQNHVNEEVFSKEGLVPINLTDVKPLEINSWTEAIQQLTNIYNEYCKEENEIRRNYMLQQIGSTIFLCRWMSNEQSIPYRELVRNLLYVNENPVTKSYHQQLHEKLDELLSRRGFDGILAEKVKKWRGVRKVEPEKLESTLATLLEEAKDKTIQIGFLEVENTRVIPKVVYDVPFQAYCDFLGESMYINGDINYTYEALKHLVTHEAFPGHTTHMTVRQKKVNAEEIPLDAGLVITNTASSSTFEGIGDNGQLFVDWMNTLDDEIYKVIQSIQSISGLVAAHMIHVERKGKEEVVEYFKSFVFAEDNWIESRLRFITHPFRAPFIYSYWRGNEAVFNVFNKVSKSSRSHFLRFLYDHMHSADTVKQFAEKLLVSNVKTLS
jgi:hypothetical protein